MAVISNEAHQLSLGEGSYEEAMELWKGLLAAGYS